MHFSIVALLMLVRRLLSPDALRPYSNRDEKLHSRRVSEEIDTESDACQLSINTSGLRVFTL